MSKASWVYRGNAAMAFPSFVGVASHCKQDAVRHPHKRNIVRHPRLGGDPTGFIKMDSRCHGNDGARVVGRPRRDAIAGITEIGDAVGKGF